MRRDPAGRGLVSHPAIERALPPSQLEHAANSLSETGQSVAIVTGFCIVDADPQAAETDGPPGAVYLAAALSRLGMEVTLVSDDYGRPLVEACLMARGLSRIPLECVPFEAGQPNEPARAQDSAEHDTRTDAWVDAFLANCAGKLTHLIAIERPSPSHTVESLVAQRRAGQPPVERFCLEVPEHDRNACHNWRGVDINGYTAKTHRLFEEVTRRRLGVTTIGLADGGNEIGCGSIPWETLCATAPTGAASRVAARIATDFTILAGVSNWAAYALAISVAHVRDRIDVIEPLDVESERGVIELLVRQAGACDGVTRLRQATVDGLPLETYLQALVAMRAVAGLRT